MGAQLSLDAADVLRDRRRITWVIEAMGESPNQATMEDLEWLRQLVKGK